jgi:endoglucanase
VKKTIAVILTLGMCALLGACGGQKSAGCLIGAFLSDKPTVATIEKFVVDYGKRPALVLIFLDWGKLPGESVVRDVYSSGSVLMVTWEPWHAEEKKAIDFEALLAGKDDAYVREFALKLKAIGRPVFLRFAHEMNGDWYPWSGRKIGNKTYLGMFRHIHDVFDKAGVQNVRWVFSINAENIPPENAYAGCYPGDRYVDYIGLDGYNWGGTQGWSRWRSFRDIFSGVYGEVVNRYKKPVILSEFSSASVGGDKARWIQEALQAIKKMPEVKGFILFNVDKETDWRFSPDLKAGQEFKAEIKDPYFLGSLERDFQ